MAGESYPPEYIVLTKRAAKRLQKFKSLIEAVDLACNNMKKYGEGRIYCCSAVMEDYRKED